jgi:hypothetical protein
MMAVDQTMVDGHHLPNLLHHLGRNKNDQRLLNQIPSVHTHQKLQKLSRPLLMPDQALLPSDENYANA